MMQCEVQGGTERKSVREVLERGKRSAAPPPDHYPQVGVKVQLFFESPIGRLDFLLTVGVLLVLSVIICLTKLLTLLSSCSPNASSHIILPCFYTTTLGLF